MGAMLDAVVIGAGWAGTATTRDLTDRGYSVALLEASDHVGGRTIGRPFPGLLNVHADLGGAWINRELQPLMRGEVARYGIALKQDKPVENVVFNFDGVSRTLPVPVEQLGELDRVMSHLNLLSTRVGPTQPLTAQTLRDLDVSAAEFFSPLQISTETFAFVNSFLSMYTGADLNQGSMLSLVAQTAAFGHSSFGFFTALTERFVHGPESLLRAMVKRGRLDVRLSHRVVSVEQSAASVTVRTADGVRVDARTCVVAVPTNVIRHIEFTPRLSEMKTDMLSVNHLGGCYKSVILARNLPRQPFAVGSGALQVLCVSAEISDDTYVLIGFGAESIERIDPADRDQVQKAVQTYFPHAEVIAVQAHNWNEDPLFDGTWRLDPAGQALDFLVEMNQPEGRVIFAGTDIDDSMWRNWMEGALSSAKQAVNVVSDQLNRDGV